MSIYKGGTVIIIRPPLCFKKLYLRINAFPGLSIFNESSYFWWNNHQEKNAQSGNSFRLKDG